MTSITLLSTVQAIPLVNDSDMTTPSYILSQALYESNNSDASCPLLLCLVISDRKRASGHRTRAVPTDTSANTSKAHFVKSLPLEKVKARCLHGRAENRNRAASILDIRAISNLGYLGFSPRCLLQNKLQYTTNPIYRVGILS